MGDLTFCSPRANHLITLSYLLGFSFSLRRPVLQTFIEPTLHVALNTIPESKSSSKKTAYLGNQLHIFVHFKNSAKCCLSWRKNF